MAQQNLTAEQQEAVIQKVGGLGHDVVCISGWGMKPIYTYIYISDGACGCCNGHNGRDSCRWRWRWC